MQDTKAIRPEIRGLFETVKQQSLQYVESFEQLEKYKQEYHEMVYDINNLAESLTLKINHEIFSLKQKYDSITKVLTIETNRALDKYSELSNLTQLQESYNNSIETIKIIKETLDKNTLQLRKETEEYSRELKHIKGNAENEIKNIIKNNDEVIRNIVNEEKDIFEIEFNAKLKTLDGRLFKVEQSTQSINNQLNTDFRRIYKDIDTLRNLVKNLNKREDDEFQTKFDTLRNTVQRLEVLHSNLSEEFYHLKINSESSLAAIKYKKVNYEEPAANSITAFFGKDYEEEYKKLEQKIEEIITNNDKLKIKFETMKYIAIGAIAFSLISIILSLLI